MLHKSDPPDEAHLMRVEEIKSDVELIATVYLDPFAAMPRRVRGSYRSLAVMPLCETWLYTRRFLNAEWRLIRAPIFDLKDGRADLPLKEV